MYLRENLPADSDDAVQEPDVSEQSMLGKLKASTQISSGFP